MSTCYKGIEFTSHAQRRMARRGIHYESVVQLVESLPHATSGTIQWREGSLIVVVQFGHPTKVVTVMKSRH